MNGQIIQGTSIQWDCIQPQRGMKYWCMIQMNELWKHYAKWNKPDKERQISYDSTFMKYRE